MGRLNKAWARQGESARLAALVRLETLLAGCLKRKRALQRSPGPIVSFTFDDFPRSALTVGGAILSEYGVRGTYYASMGLLGMRTIVGEMFNSGDLEALVSAGHELACHTLDHKLCSDMAASRLLASCRENQGRIAAVPGSANPRSFSFPEGVVTVAAKEALGAMYDTCRTIEPGVNRDPVDLAFLRAYRVYAESGVAGVCEAIRRNERENGWVILYAHDVGASPSQYGCTTSQFREVVRCAVESCSEVLPVREAAKRFSLSGGPRA